MYDDKITFFIFYIVRGIVVVVFISAILIAWLNIYTYESIIGGTVRIGLIILSFWAVHDLRAVYLRLGHDSSQGAWYEVIPVQLLRILISLPIATSITVLVVKNRFFARLYSAPPAPGRKSP
jgi:hypothetical protein